MRRKRQFAARLALEADPVAQHVPAAHEYIEKSQMFAKIVLNPWGKKSIMTEVASVKRCVQQDFPPLSTQRPLRLK